MASKTGPENTQLFIYLMMHVLLFGSVAFIEHVMIKQSLVTNLLIGPACRRCGKGNPNVGFPDNSKESKGGRGCVEIYRFVQDRKRSFGKPQHIAIPVLSADSCCWVFQKFLDARWMETK